jgi:hypothetical protein
MAAPSKLVSLRNRSLDPQVKSWIDNVIVPTLVREYLASQKQSVESLKSDTPMVQCRESKKATKGIL